MRSVRIPLHSRKYPDLFAIVDEADAELVNQYRWNPLRHKSGFYATARESQKTVYLHRLIVGFPEGQEVDHANRDGLDNRRSNLRVCSRSGNTSNRARMKSNTTGFVGVEYRANGRFQAAVWVNYHKVSLGTFDTAEDAARARDAAARDAFGEFASLNFPRSDERGV